MNGWLPGYTGPIAATDEAVLHQAGFDYLGIRTDPSDNYGKDPDIAPETREELARERLPQFGPGFVTYAHERFTRLERLMEAAMHVWSYQPMTQKFFASLQTTAAGAVDLTTQGNASLVEPPVGMAFALHRFAIFGPGFNFGTPFNAAGAYWEIRLDGQPWDGGSLVSGQGSLPVVRYWGTRDALHVRDGEVLSLFLNAGPASAQLVVTLQGTFKRNPDA